MKNKNIKIFKTFSFVFSLLMIFFLGFKSPSLVSAQSADCFDIEGTYAEFPELTEGFTTVPGVHSFFQSGNNSTSNTLWIGTMFCTTCYCTGEDVMSNDKISPSNKIGLVEMAGERVKALMYNPPAVNVAEHIAQEWVPGYKASTTSVLADGGYEELETAGAIPLWNRTRNIAYLFFVVAMIGAGFMIMFRTKLGGQTLVTLGNVIPNIIISLVLVTFSFAIAGIIIDIGAVLTNIVLSILYGPNPAFDPITIGNPFEILWKNWGAMSTARRQITWDALNDPMSTSSIVQTTKLIAGMMNPITPLSSASRLTGNKISIIGTIISGIMFVGAIQVFISLVKSYLLILINVIIGPLQIMISAFPGQKHMLTNWLKSLLRNTLVFPVILAMVNLPYALFGENLNFNGLPSALTGGGGSLGEGSTVAREIWGSLIDIDLLVLNILRIVVLFMAAQAPKLLEAILPSDSPKALAEGMAKAKESFSKIPLVGGMFK